MLENIKNVMNRIQNIQNKFGKISENYSNKLLKNKVLDGKVDFSTCLESEINKTDKKVTKNQTSVEQIIEKTAKKYDISSDLIKKVVKVESNFDKNAVSSKGAVGLMQLMPETAAELGVKDPFDEQENIEGGVKYLKSLMNKYDDDVKLALAAYNAGMGNVDKFKGVPPFKETQNYLRQILGNKDGIDV